MLGIFLDTETNGLNARTHRVLDIAIKIVDLITGRELETYQTKVALSRELWDKGDPDSLRVNGYTWEEMQGAPPPETVAQEIIDLFARHNIKRRKAVFICQNPSFDRAFFAQLIAPETQELLSWPYHWLDLASMHWALMLDRAKHKKSPLPWETGYSKDMIASYYRLPPEQKPHRALNGANHLFLCYTAAVGFPKA